MFERVLTNGLILRNPTEDDIGGMALVQRTSFPTLAQDEILTAEHFAKHRETFLDGQFVLVDGDRVIGSTSTFRTEFPTGQHTFREATGDLWITTHEPDGEWLYGFDMGIDPAYRGRGLARILYGARHQLCKTLGLEGQVIVGMPSGFGAVRTETTIDEYLNRVKAGELFDPTVSIQQKMGFEVVQLIPNHLSDPLCGNYGVLMKLPVHRELELVS